MTALARLTHALDTRVDNIAGWIVMPTLARFAFAAVLLTYFWRSANTKIGDSFFSIDFGAYAQVLPRVFENVGFDASQIGFVGRAIVAVGTYSEFILPALIVVGLLTRLAALGMIGFVFVQSYVDLFGHNAWDESVGFWFEAAEEGGPERFNLGWFDAASGSLIADQRLMWVTVLMILVFRGAGPISLDGLIRLISGAPRSASVATA